ncbi:hypothetical protein ACFL0T_06145 [Candidatus Omnitrophota bacterium]
MEKKRLKGIIVLGCSIVTIFSFPFSIFAKLLISELKACSNAASGLDARMFPVLFYYGIWTFFSIFYIIIGIGILFQKKWARSLFLKSLVILLFPFTAFMISIQISISSWQRYAKSMIGGSLGLGIFMSGLIMWSLFRYLTHPKIKEQFE